MASSPKPRRLGFGAAVPAEAGSLPALGTKDCSNRFVTGPSAGGANRGRTSAPQDPLAEPVSESLCGRVEYCRIQRDHLPYQRSAEQGAPVGSGSVELFGPQLQGLLNVRANLGRQSGCVASSNSTSSTAARTSKASGTKSRPHSPRPIGDALWMLSDSPNCLLRRRG